MVNTTTLRAYLDDVHVLLESGSTTKVISHCRYILQHYPRNVETYRLLAQAILDRGERDGVPEYFDEALEVFQRVLSVLPNDMIAHRDVSRIRERDGQFDQAVWHMERAHEQRPGDQSLQEALRTLYGQRTGEAAPAKLQLSRGALIRQYINAQLYDQALVELRTALNAAPDRIDLQVLMAETLWETRHVVEAGETAVAVLKRLPYCLSANRVMARLWLDNERPTDAQVFLDRIEAVDAYAARRVLNPDLSLPDTNTIIRLDYETETQSSLSAETPDWVTELSELEGAAGQMWTPGSEVSFDAAVGPAVSPFVGGQSDWFGDDVDLDAPMAPETPEAAASEESFSDWLEEMGTDAEDATTDSADEPTAQMSLAPDWFADMQPDAAEQEADQPDLTPDIDFDDWTQDQMPGTDDIGEPEFPSDWELELGESEAPATLADDPAVPGDVPDWLNAPGLASDEDAEGDAASPAIGLDEFEASPPREDDTRPLPLDWMPEKPAADDELPEVDADNFSEWLADDSFETASETASETAEEPSSQADVDTEDDDSDWLGDTFDPGAEPDTADDEWLTAGAAESAVDDGDDEGAISDFGNWSDIESDADEPAQAANPQGSGFTDLLANLDRHVAEQTDDETPQSEVPSPSWLMSDDAADDRDAIVAGDDDIPDWDFESVLETADDVAAADEPEPAMFESASDFDHVDDDTDAQAWTAMTHDSSELPHDDSDPADELDALRNMVSDESDLSDDAAEDERADASLASDDDASDWMMDPDFDFFGSAKQAPDAEQSEGDGQPEFDGAWDAVPAEDSPSEAPESDESTEEDDLSALFGSAPEDDRESLFTPPSEDDETDDVIGWGEADAGDQDWLGTLSSEDAAEDEAVTADDALDEIGSWTFDTDDEPVDAAPASAAWQMEAEDAADAGWQPDDAESDDAFEFDAAELVGAADDEVEDTALSVYSDEDESPLDSDGSDEDEPASTRSVLGLLSSDRIKKPKGDDSPAWLEGLEVDSAEDDAAEMDDVLDVPYDPFEEGNPDDVPSYEGATQTGVLQPDELPPWMTAFTGDEMPQEDEFDEFELQPLEDEQDVVEPEEDEAAMPSFENNMLDEPDDISDESVELEPEPEADKDAAFDLEAEPEPEPKDEEGGMPSWLREIAQSEAGKLDAELLDDDEPPVELTSIETVDDDISDDAVDLESLFGEIGFDDEQTLEADEVPEPDEDAVFGALFDAEDETTTGAHDADVSEAEVDEAFDALFDADTDDEAEAEADEALAALLESDEDDVETLVAMQESDEPDEDDEFEAMFDFEDEVADTSATETDVAEAEAEATFDALFDAATDADTDDEAEAETDDALAALFDAEDEDIEAPVVMEESDEPDEDDEFEAMFDFEDEVADTSATETDVAEAEAEATFDALFDAATDADTDDEAEAETDEALAALLYAEDKDVESPVAMEEADESDEDDEFEALFDFEGEVAATPAAETDVAETEAEAAFDALFDAATDADTDDEAEAETDEALAALFDADDEGVETAVAVQMDDELDEVAGAEPDATADQSDADEFDFDAFLSATDDDEADDAAATAAPVEDTVAERDAAVAAEDETTELAFDVGATDDDVVEVADEPELDAFQLDDESGETEFEFEPGESDEVEFAFDEAETVTFEFDDAEPEDIVLAEDDDESLDELVMEEVAEPDDIAHTKVVESEIEDDEIEDTVPSDDFAFDDVVPVWLRRPKEDAPSETVEAAEDDADKLFPEWLRDVFEDDDSDDDEDDVDFD